MSFHQFLSSQVLKPFISGAGQAIGQGLANRLSPSRLGQQFGRFLTDPRRLAGIGLIGAGLAQPEEPGYVTEARQFIRNQFTSPTALAEQFTGQIGALSKPFQPLLTQARERGIRDIQQRFAHAFPGTVGAQGPEFTALGRFISEEALPREQALLGDIGLRLLTRQSQAARDLLETRPGVTLGEQLAQLGTLMSFPEALPGGDGAQLLDKTGIPMGMVDQKTGAVATGAGISPNIINQVLQAALQTVPTGQAAQTAGGIARGGGGISQPLGPLAAGAAGFGVGRSVGRRLPNQATGALSGAASGAATGALIGSMSGNPLIGALAGAAGGAAGGFFGQRGREHAEKEALRQADVGRRSNLVEGIGNFWTPTFQELGLPDAPISQSTLQFARDTVDDLIGRDIPISKFSRIAGLTPLQAIPQFVSLVGDDVYSRIMIGAVFGKHLDEQLKKNPVINPQTGQRITGAKDVPGLKDNFIDTLTQLFTMLGQPEGFDEPRERLPFIQSAQLGPL